MKSHSHAEITRRIDEVTRFLSATLALANAHTVEFYTRDVWKQFVDVSPREVLRACESAGGREGATERTGKGSRTAFGFCVDSKRLVDVDELLDAARLHSLPGLGVCTSREELQLELGPETMATTGDEFVADEFMNSKKSHEVCSMSDFVFRLARRCKVTQVIDVGSGKGYLSAFLSLRLRVYGIDASDTNTRGARERNRKLRKFSRAYRKQAKASGATPETERCHQEEAEPEAEELARDEKERRKRENTHSDAFSPLTSYITAETELRDLIAELEQAMLVGLHTCGDLAASTLRMFAAKSELRAVCSVGCCYHLLTETFGPEGLTVTTETTGPEERCQQSVCGFPLSRHLGSKSWFCGRNARMSACLSMERVSAGRGIQMESLFYRAVLHVILRDHYGSFKSEKRVGNVYAKTTSFVDYVHRALRRLELDEGKLSDGDIQSYHDAYRARADELRAFNMLKVSIAPCMEGLILLDRLCFLKEQEDVSMAALVKLFDPLLSPRCYAVVGLKK